MLRLRQDRNIINVTQSPGYLRHVAKVFSTGCKKIVMPLQHSRNIRYWLQPGRIGVWLVQLSRNSDITGIFSAGYKINVISIGTTPLFISCKSQMTFLTRHLFRRQEAASYCFLLFHLTSCFCTVQKQCYDCRIP